MKLFILIIIISVCSTVLMAQNVAINATGAAPNSSAMLDVSSTRSGMLIPRMTTAQRNTIASPATGLLVYDTTTDSFWYYDGSQWVEFISGNNNDDWHLDGNAGTTAGTDFLGTTDNISMDFRTNNTIRLRITNSGRIGIGTTSPSELLHLNGNIRGNQSGALRISTGYGYIDVGPKNTSWAHFYTDRPRFYFQKGITVDQGLIGSYNEDLQIQRAGTTRLWIKSSEAVFNETGANYDFRVEGDTKSNLFWIDANYDHIYVNNTTYTAGDIFTVRANSQWNSSDPWLVNSYNDYSSGGAGFFHNTNSSDGYNAVECITQGTNCGVWGWNDNSGIGVKGSVTNTVWGWAGYFSGDVACTGSYYSSDKRWKKNIKPLNNALEKVMLLEPKSYNWDTENYPGMGFNPNRTTFGFIAQDLENVFPEIVENNKFIPDPTQSPKARSESNNVQGYYMVDYVSLIPVLTKAIQEQQKIIEDLEKRIEQLENK